MRRLITLPLLALVSLAASAGAVYKWTDASGQVHYGQTPPNGSHAELQGNLKPAAGMDAPVTPKVAEAPPGSGAATPKPGEKPPESAADKAKRCTDAQSRVAFLEEKTARRLSVTEKDGTPARMTDEQFNERLTKAKAEVASACGK